jgi:hypothetical protein
MKTKFYQISSKRSNPGLFQRWLIIMLVVASLVSCSQESTKTTDSKTTAATAQEKPKSEAEKFTFRVIPAAENTFGYEILDQGKILVQQKTIPAMPGNNGFKTEDDAKKCADFVISKLNRNIMPPSVTPEELDSLGIITNSNITN